MGFSEKIALSLFILGLKTKRIVNSAVSGRINYYAKIYLPFVIGLLIIGWALFVYSL